MHQLHLVDDDVHLRLLDALDRQVLDRLLLAALEHERVPAAADLVLRAVARGGGAADA